MTELEAAVWELLTEREIKTLGDQKQLTRDIVALFPPQNLTHYALKAIVEQLRLCEYECEGGPLILNTAFLALAELANLR